jgi:hypothetical protein
MDQYLYAPLSLPGSIRLLQLCPRNEDLKNIRCKLLEYPFRNSNSSHLYDAVSYVWGSEDKPESVLIDNQSLKITSNLYALLLRLQDDNLSRVIWVDAICINQEDDKEKEHQIPLMAEIYAKANRVLVWLGEAEDDSDQALKAIRYAGQSSVKHSAHTESQRQLILKLLRRPWFQRIWVRLQISRLLSEATEYNISGSTRGCSSSPYLNYVWCYRNGWLCILFGSRYSGHIFG